MLEPTVSAHRSTAATFGCTAMSIQSTDGTVRFTDVLVLAVTSAVLKNEEYFNSGDFLWDYIFLEF